MRDRAISAKWLAHRVSKQDSLHSFEKKISLSKNGSHFEFLTNMVKLKFYCVNTSYPMDNCFTGRRDRSRQTPEKDVLYIIPAGPVSSVYSLGGASYLLPVKTEWRQFIFFIRRRRRFNSQHPFLTGKKKNPATRLLAWRIRGQVDTEICEFWIAGHVTSQISIHDRQG